MHTNEFPSRWRALCAYGLLTVVLVVTVALPVASAWLREPIGPEALGTFNLFAGQLVLFRVLRLHGSRKLSIVTYLMPMFAVVYGALLLDEPVTAAMLAGFSLIVVGAALASGQRFFGVRAQESAV